jgi:hypothetical protein
MNDETYNAKMEQWLAEEYAALSPETFHQFDKETINELVTAALSERARAEAESDPEFKEQLYQEGAKALVDQVLQERLPKGSYREDGLIPIRKEIWMEMPKAKRGDLLSWYSIEEDPANLRYLTSRIKAWDPDKHQTLADLERDISGTN